MPPADVSPFSEAAFPITYYPLYSEGKFLPTNDQSLILAQASTDLPSQVLPSQRQ